VTGVQTCALPIYGRERDHRAALASPRAARRCKRVGIVAHERLLLIRREFDHALPAVGMERREDAPAGSEVGMGHVLAFDRVLHRERDAAEVVRLHGDQSIYLADTERQRRWPSMKNGRRAGRQLRPADTIHASNPNAEALVGVPRSFRSEDVRRLVAAGSATGHVLVQSGCQLGLQRGARFPAVLSGVFFAGDFRRAIISQVEVKSGSARTLLTLSGDAQAQAPSPELRRR